MKVLILIYAKYTTNEYGDKTGDLIEQVEEALNNDDDLKSLTTYYHTESILQDGGIMYPFTMAEIKYSVEYRH